MSRTWRNIHPKFKLNGFRHRFEDLTEIGYSLIKEGEPHEVDMGAFLLDWISKGPTLEVGTSGSTGTPKTIVLKKAHMVQSAMATGQYFNLEPGDAALLCLPCSGIAGKMMLVRAMVLGLELDYVQPSSEPLTNLNKTYEFSAMVPLQAEKSLGQLCQINKLLIGGAPVTFDLRQKLKLVSSDIFETYGMTETITHIAVKKIANEHVKSSVTQPNDQAAETYFEILPNITVTLDDRSCLVIHAPSISDQKVITNDRVELIDASKFRWLGRYDSIINSGGVKLFPEQIEEKLSQIIASRFFVAGAPDNKLGEKLILLVEGKEPSKPDLSTKIRALEGLGKYEKPKEIHFIESFAETVSGKIDRNKTLQKI